jgi:calcineurin-like phosphoesterase family protein
MQTYTLEESKNVFLTSDFHFGHRNIISYCNRPFATVEEMNETLFNNYKKVIGDTSLVYFLGDMSFGRQERKEQTCKWWCEQLPGTIVTYIKGSHDHGIRPTMAVLPKNVQKVLLEDYIEVYGLDIERGYLRFKLQHEPDYGFIPEGDDYDWLLHGHVHNNRPMWNVSNKSINLSVEATFYAPVVLYNIVNEIITKNTENIMDLPLPLNMAERML